MIELLDKFKSVMEDYIMANFIEELYYGNIESQNMKKKKSKSYSRKYFPKTKMFFWKNFPKRIKSCFSNMLMPGVLLTENLLLIALLPDSDLEQDLRMIHLYLLNRMC